ncbi:MAG: hypothetical protein QOJ73_3406, partial [Streptosporangiaceae bacterium]|nr:hypothetical protein [Streptosporangiaceae bacterium]
DVEQAELRDLVWAALGGLNPGEREVIELNLRHEFDGADLADVLGVPRNQAHALASRARSQFEMSLGVLLVARTGQEYCPDLAEILDGWDGELTPLIRKRVNRHIDRCDVCGERKRRELNPAMLLGLLPAAVLSAKLREQVFHLVADTAPGSLADRARVVHQAEPFGSSGFPPQISSLRIGRPPRVGNVGRAAVATVAAAALLAGGLLFLRHHPGPPAAAGPQPRSSGAPGAPGAPGAGPHASASGPGSGSGRSPGGPGSTSQPRSRLVGSSVAPAPAPTLAGPGPPPAPAIPSSPAPVSTGPASQPASPPPAVPGTLSVSPTLVQVGLTITLTAEGGPVSYSITTPAVIAVSSSSGTLKAGASVSVTVSVALGQVLTLNATLTIYPGPTRVIVVPL